MKPSKISVFLLILTLGLLTLGGCALALALTAPELGAFLRDAGPLCRGVRWLLLGVSLLAAGMVAGAAFLMPSIRERREVGLLQRKVQAMERLNQTQQQLAHHQRLELLGTLSASIAHEFNNLLTPIMGYSLMALEKLPADEEELYDSILEIYNASRKAKTIISRLGDLSRKGGDATFTQVAPDELVRRTLDVAMPAKPKNVELRLNLNCWDQRITGGELQLSQLLLNLILNGFHAMEPEGGVLTVDTAFDDSSVRIRVSDTGCGIPAAMQGKIFEPFFTTKEQGRGTGLGLAIAAQVAEDHHGTITVESRPGEGAAFTVTLPREQTKTDD
ncbi:MAG: HAMP domain-containing sensor histidine kinase [Eubacteriales bacterium]|nr:HAMP domain-containing sensor histidine kinase [Eubacteriales bacterium]